MVTNEQKLYDNDNKLILKTYHSKVYASKRFYREHAHTACELSLILKAVLGGCDAIAFTAGVGENGNEYREQVLAGLEDMGIVLDKDKNGKDFKRGQINEISAASSKVKIYVIPTDEELMIARDTKILTQI